MAESQSDCIAAAARAPSEPGASAQTSITGSDSPAKLRTVEGYVDNIDGRQVSGWAYDKARPDLVLDVEIHCGGELIALARADQPRADLLKAGKGDGRHAFVVVLDVNISSDEVDRIDVFARCSDVGDLVPLVSRPRQQLAALRGKDAARNAVCGSNPATAAPVGSAATANAAICAIVKNEGRYLREWLAYHTVIGFSHFYIFNNESIDETADILSEAQSKGFCTVYDWPSRQNERPQLTAYKYCLEKHSTECDWIMFLDADEFLNIKVHRTIGELVSDYPEASALGIHWRMFGDSGETDYRPGLIVDRFTRAAPEQFGGNRHVKTIARTRDIVEPFVHAHRLVDGASFVDLERRPLKHLVARQDSVSHKIAQVNHYFTKSRGEWNVKRMRGKADLWMGHKDHIRGDSEFDIYNRNDDVDYTILSRRASLLEVMSEIFS